VCHIANAGHILDTSNVVGDVYQNAVRTTILGSTKADIIASQFAKAEKQSSSSGDGDVPQDVSVAGVTASSVDE